MGNYTILQYTKTKTSTHCHVMIGYKKGMEESISEAYKEIKELKDDLEYYLEKWEKSNNEFYKKEADYIKQKIKQTEERIENYKIKARLIKDILFTEIGPWYSSYKNRRV